MAEILSVHKNWVYEKIRNDNLPHIRIGSLIRVREAELEDWLDQHRK